MKVVLVIIITLTRMEAAIQDHRIRIQAAVMEAAREDPSYTTHVISGIITHIGDRQEFPVYGAADAVQMLAPPIMTATSIIRPAVS